MAHWMVVPDPHNMLLEYIPGFHVVRLSVDGVTVAQIKTMIALDSPEGEARERAAIASTLQAAVWMGSPLGTQLALFDEPDRTPSVDRAFDEGKKDSMENKPAKPAYAPDLPQYKSYMDGYAEDQDRRAQTIGRGNAAAH